MADATSREALEPGISVASGSKPQEANGSSAPAGGSGTAPSTRAAAEAAADDADEEDLPDLATEEVAPPIPAPLTDEDDAPPPLAPDPLPGEGLPPASSSGLLTRGRPSRDYLVPSRSDPLSRCGSLNKPRCRVGSLRSEVV